MIDSSNSISLQPKGGLVGNNQTQGKAFNLPEGSYFDSAVKTEEILIICASNSMINELRERFDAKACVQIYLPYNLLDRISYALPGRAVHRVEPVVHYSLVDEPKPKWALPEMIAFSNINSYPWQDEFRYVLAITDVSPD
jgi:hypothetical protein